MKNAMIIEDNRLMSDSLAAMVKVLGFKTIQAFTPRSGIAKLEEFIPDVIFLDINLPTVDGFEVLAFLRRDPRTVNTPVVIVTSEDQQQTYQRAREGKAAGVVIKPATLEAIESVLKKIGLVP
jgi:CheY-like chemotaxis protein